jgi:c-di-GMP phosphodiesterase
MDTNDTRLPAATFARLPIFDRNRILWGYELVYMPAFENDTALSLKKADLTADLMSGISLAMDQVMDRGKQIMVDFSWKNLADNLPWVLPPDRTTIKIRNVKTLSDSWVPVLNKLKKSGFQLAVAWNLDDPACQPLFERADMICLNISGRKLPELSAICRDCADFDSAALAVRVDTQTTFEVCCQAGFSFFQGSFFKQPEDVSIKKVFPGTVSRFKLLEAIEQNDPDFADLAALIQADVAISFRLLSYLNSASFGFRRKIESIRDAITLLGWQNLKNWLRVILLSEVSACPHASELIFLSAQRGKFLEQVGKDHDFWGFEPDSLFLLGMFSLLDALLNQPMNQVVNYLPLADKLKGALCMEGNNEYVPFLELARCFEEARYVQIDAMISRLGLDRTKVNQAYGGAIDWAGRLCELSS